MMYAVVLYAVVLGFWVAEAGSLGDQCDWTGSGLTLSSSRGVTPVYVRCRAGGVSWLYPRGALRLLLRPPLPAARQHFRVCIRVLRRPDPPDIFYHSHNNDTQPERFPARIFVEGKHRLIPLYAADDGDPRELRCFHSRDGRAALYVEAEPEEDTKRRVAEFKYEARPLGRPHYDPTTADCRPCSDAELELAFCTSDLVSRGTFVGSEQREDLDSTQLTLRMSKLIRATADDARDLLDAADINTDDYNRYDVENAVIDNSINVHARSSASARSLHAHVHVTRTCEAAIGEGEFLVMARRRLGKYSLVCAPRLHDWEELVKRRNAQGNTHCLLQH